MLGDNLDTRECASGGRYLGNGVGLEEGGAAVLVADDRAIGHLGLEAHEALDGGVRHGVSSFCLPGDLALSPGRLVGCRRRFSRFLPTTCSLHV